MKTPVLLFLCALGLNAFAQSSIVGPDAPVVSAQFQNGEFHLTLTNPPLSNNFNENYIEADTNLSAAPDPFFRFQGYQVYQVANANVTIDDLHDLSLARLVSQSDLQDTIGTLINTAFDPGLGNCLGNLEVAAANAGLDHNPVVAQDAFGSAFLENEQYCFMAVAYAHNPYFTNAACAPFTAPYLRGKTASSGGIQPVCVTANEANSVNDYPRVAQLVLSPNPANDAVTISVPAGDDLQLEIYDMLGQTVASQNIDGPTRLDLGQFQRGNYFVRIQSASGASKVEKLVVY